MQENLTFEQTMEKLSVTRQTIYNYIDKGYLKPIKAFNNRVYFDRIEVLRLLEPKNKIPFGEE